MAQEIKRILKGLDGLKIVGADIVEVAPAYDTQGERRDLSPQLGMWVLIRD